MTRPLIKRDIPQEPLPTRGVEIIGELKWNSAVLKVCCNFYARGGTLLEPCLLAYEFLFEIFGKGYLACLAKSIANSSSHDLLPIFNGLDYSSVREM